MVVPFPPGGSIDMMARLTRKSHEVDAREAALRALRVVTEGKVRSVGGKDIAMRADCTCVHSETPRAFELARTVGETLAPCLA